MEHRSFKGNVELREGPSGPVICGYGVVFNSRSADMGFIETVAPEAVTKTLNEADIIGTGNHDDGWLLGRTRSGTMRLKQDAQGVFYEIDVNSEDPDGQRALAKVRRGDWDGSSFEFETIRDEWNWQVTPPERRLLEMRLRQMGPVTAPAYPDATAASRALQPIAEKLGKPVDALVAALKNPVELRSLLGGNTMSASENGTVGESSETAPAATNSLRALSPVTATVMWGSEDGFCDLISDVNAELAGIDSGMSCVDAAIGLDKVLICDWADGCYYVAEIAVDDMSEPHLAPQSEWVPVESGWLVDSDEGMGRAFSFVVEQRSGKVISAANLDSLRVVHEGLLSAAKNLRDLMDVALGEAPADSEIGSGEDESGRSLGVLAAALEVRRRVVEAEAA